MGGSGWLTFYLNSKPSFILNLHCCNIMCTRFDREKTDEMGVRRESFRMYMTGRIINSSIQWQVYGYRCRHVADKAFYYIWCSCTSTYELKAIFSTVYFVIVLF